MPLANFNFGDALLLVVEIFLLVIWIWILFVIIGDLFRDHETSGWGKALWIIFLVILPFLGCLIYLIARGSGMRERTIKAEAEAKRHMDTYIREQAYGSPAEELSKLNDLKEKGAISNQEFETAKAKLLG